MKSGGTDPLSPRHLVAYPGIHPTTLTGILDRLERVNGSSEVRTPLEVIRDFLQRVGEAATDAGAATRSDDKDSHAR